MHPTEGKDKFCKLALWVASGAGLGWGWWVQLRDCGGGKHCTSERASMLNMALDALHSVADIMHPLASCACRLLKASSMLSKA